MNKVVLRGANSYLFKIKADKLPEYACQLLLAHSLSLAWMERLVPVTRQM